MEPIYWLVVNTLRPLLAVFFRWRLIGVERVPARGPVIFAANHISYFDPLCHGKFIAIHARRRIRFFAKAELWRNPFLRVVLRGAHQIPVQRGSGELGPVEGALAALRKQEAVIIYPEATISKDPNLLPTAGKTGIARVALASGAPVIPLAVWGSQWVSPKGRKRGRRIGRLVVVKAGAPLRFQAPDGREDDPAVLREVVASIMAELTKLVVEIQALHPDGARVPDPVLRRPKEAA